MEVDMFFLYRVNNMLCKNKNYYYNSFVFLKIKRVKYL